MRDWLARRLLRYSRWVAFRREKLSVAEQPDLWLGRTDDFEAMLRGELPVREYVERKKAANKRRVA